ncbi:class I SAM-dependent rRNA methyltransferase [Gilvimarinus agarilyticus]|uniref:class I SAM-dependent rRNA methyltransferase n=1 Tax=Gilvimarinus sp. 2_MG-2023 TaxID=3062666 RepID=UPI001C090D7C|nr:class I SAM-dependent rRNA methyltransferase [Gilvimarinus sp. 2_MG-2023]MBU2886582.1 class I SAM-dependent rRNA methyltransferase [Gilvimarinus agarilyticus]MDO6571250.1 class I SAM-dependent rRNA methyltransferase [Gilvimarinus sp. 2_MG-2023]
MSLATLYLNPQKDRRVKRGHLWIYSNEVDTKRSPLKGIEPGAAMRVVNARDQFIGVALVNPASLICARLISRQDAPFSAADFAANLLPQRLQSALGVRDAAFSEPYYRLIFGDSDFLPGLVVDRFGDYLVVQIASAGMENLRAEIVEALVTLLSPKGVLLANEHSARSLEGLPLYTEVAYGEVPEQVPLIENGAHFLAPVRTGQKTGWFYDHRMARAQLQSWAKGARVLDVFSYIGGWGIEALVAGAESLVCVDASQSAVDAVYANAALNSVEDRVEAIAGKAIDALKQLIAQGRQFDVVVLDPPAFIKRRKDQQAGEAAYRHINELGLQLLADGGLLVSASCSMHLAEQTLIEIVHASAWKRGRDARIIQRMGQGADHPTHPAIVETNYLKAIFARVTTRPS